ncbi:hypothetical protein ElyMa_000367200 [Elysia marginata]|uniref:DUF6729 domain-containing protein n=1 Tax=Elysia marginata TaxID=1093978 RepID=A0AAV4FG12_9GAST|nr:hypothetical protein ElyMa_000367200 [Elysia marginata]
MGAEDLESGKCHKNPAWNQSNLKQLGPAQPIGFTAVLSYKLALDRRIVAKVGDQVLYNSLTMLRREPENERYAEYMKRTIRYYRHQVEFRKMDVLLLTNKQVAKTIDLFTNLTDADQAPIQSLTQYLGPLL